MVLILFFQLILEFKLLKRYWLTNSFNVSKKIFLDVSVKVECIMSLLKLMEMLPYISYFISWIIYDFVKQRENPVSVFFKKKLNLKY